MMKILRFYPVCKQPPLYLNAVHICQIFIRSPIVVCWAQQWQFARRWWSSGRRRSRARIPVQSGGAAHVGGSRPPCLPVAWPWGRRGTGAAHPGGCGGCVGTHRGIHYKSAYLRGRRTRLRSSRSGTCTPGSQCHAEDRTWLVRYQSNLRRPAPQGCTQTDRRLRTAPLLHSRPESKCPISFNFYFLVINLLRIDCV